MVTVQSVSKVSVKMILILLVVATLGFTITVIMNYGLGALIEPYVLAPIISLLGSGGAYIEAVGARKHQKRLRYLGRVLIVLGLAILALLVARLFKML